MNRTKKSGASAPNPVLTANFFSKWTFWWLRDLLRKGYSRPLNEDEIYENKPWLDSERNTKKIEDLWHEELKKKSPSMLKVIMKAYGFRIVALDLLYCSLEILARLLQPLCLGALVTYFVADQTAINKETAYLYATVIVLCSLVPALVFHAYILYLFELARKLGLGCAGLIYDKILRLSKAASNDGLSGRAINLLSNDLAKFDLAVCFAHHLWKGPVEAVLLTYFMYREMGVSAMIGVAFMLSFIPLQTWAAKRAAYYRRLSAERTDFRVKLMNEIIQGIQVIKMYAWESSFASVVGRVRRKEINAIRGKLYIHAGLYSITTVPRVSIFLSILSFILFGDILTARKVFIVSSFFNALKDSMVFFWPLAIMFVAEGNVSVKRVQEFLLEKEDRKVHSGDKGESINIKETKENGFINLDAKIVNNDTQGVASRRTVNLHAKSKGVVLRDAMTAWESEGEDVMKNFNIEVENSSLVVVVGPVGSGKSSLLNVIIGELELKEGFVIVNGKLSYASQEPWIFEGTVRDNIIFIDEYDEERYCKVVHACALERDFELFPNGDQTMVGERGVSLSGGQKARLSLARAVYRQADIYLLDDPLSAVDTQVGRHIFDNCIKGYLKDKIVILVTHQLQYLKDVEHIIFINGGRIEGQGSYKNLQKMPGMQFLAETHDESESNMDKSEAAFAEVTKTATKKTNEKNGEDMKEQQATGSVSFRVYASYFKSLDQYSLMFVVFLLFFLARGMLAAVDYYLSRWVIWEEANAFNRRLVLESDLNSTKESLLDDGSTEREQTVIVYSGLLVSGLLLHLMRTFGFYIMCLRISLNLHDRLFRGITRAKMRFFNTNPSGRILNRFSKDIHTIDAFIPDTMADCLSFIVDFAAVLAIVVVVNYWLLAPTIVISILFYLMRTIYVNSGRSIKRMEAISRSPIFSHTNQTLQGITTIRSFGAEPFLKEEFHYFQNRNTAAYYLFLASTRAFAFWLDLVCVLYIAVVTYSFLLLEDQFQSGDVGLAVMQSITMIGMCQWGMRQTAELENQMTSVERVVEYVEEPPEPGLEPPSDHHVPANWPEKGHIIFNEVSLRYSEYSEPVLKDLNFVIEDREKIGIVGRTGAGKSSMIQAIFRLAINHGTILVDGVDINNLGLHDLRKKISIIPQDPILFSGTLRYNLDPFDTKTDADLWKALEDVELKTYVKTLTNGLNYKMSDGGSNFSMGQRQLVCLARAILRNNKILILDEATANVDPETDKLIQRTIRTKFADCTVLTIAHRLHTVMDSDRVLVVDAGRAVEIGPPYELLQKSDGHLRNLVNRTGSGTAAVLMEVAKTNYKGNLNLNETSKEHRE